MPTYGLYCFVEVFFFFFLSSHVAKPNNLLSNPGINKSTFLDRITAAYKAKEEEDPYV